MPKFFYSIALVLFALSTTTSIIAQCPGCIIDVPPLSEDTIWLSDIPDGEVGMSYAEDMSFRLPKTTTPVNANDPDTPAGLTISEITITSLVNLPPGIQWTASQTVFDTAEETDGCIRLCGTPLVADTFEVEVNITAIVFGFPQNTSFTVPMVINPAMSSSDGFSMTNNIGCGTSTVEFSNNVISNGADGFSYQWDFGNGTTSTEENPSPVIYDQAGVYIVSYEATVDTAAYFLTEVTVVEAACDDIFGNAPDMSITVDNPDGSQLFATADYENTFPPITHTGFYEIGDGDYYMEVIDDDISGDDVCGTLNFNKFSNGIITVGDLTVELTILHLTTTVISTDTVVIYEQPADPVVSSSIGAFEFCDGESIELISSYANNNQWYQDGLPLTGAVTDTLEIDGAGIYTVEYTSADGCVSSAAEIEITIISAPVSPAFVNDNNLLTLFDENSLPIEYELQWYQDGDILEGENGLDYCIMAFGAYTLAVTDLETGCSNSFTQTVPFNAGAGCATSTSDLLGNYQIKLSPNPTDGLMELTMNAPQSGQMTLRIQNLNGQVIYSYGEGFGMGVYRKVIDLTDVAAGLYLVQLQVAEEVWVEKVVVF